MLQAVASSTQEAAALAELFAAIAAHPELIDELLAAARARMGDSEKTDAHPRRTVQRIGATR